MTTASTLMITHGGSSRRALALVMIFIHLVPLHVSKQGRLQGHDKKLAQGPHCTPIKRVDALTNRIWSNETSVKQ